MDAAPRAARSRTVRGLLGLASVLAITAAAWGAPSAAAMRSRAATGSPLVIGDLAPFTGPDAVLGPGFLAGCYVATNAINKAGGVEGHPLQCKSFDTRGDPADAVPAARQMFASTPNLVMVIGPTSDEAAAVVPIVNANHMVVFSGTGQGEFDKSPFKYFFRLTPPDAYSAYAMVATAHFRFHWSRIAFAFGNDIGSQAFVQPANQAVKAFHMKLTTNQVLNLTASTFRTEADAVAASHPQVILTEALGPTDATFLSEVEQLNHGKMIPVIGTSATIDPNWYSAVAKAVGASTLQHNYYADALGVKTVGVTYAVFKQNLIAIHKKITWAPWTGYLDHPQTFHFYDAVTMASLAMIESHSTKASVYRKDIKPIANGVRGAVVVTSFAQGLRALRAGKKIHYVGPGGPTHFNKYNNSQVNFQIDKYGSGGKVQIVGSLPASDVSAAQK
ncbi:MAG TPA: ABC transporter substrate-binding protein [Candidatus Micrarchaeia archaeon]|nr:ABC transporter substrate-binding protein [Candidatus Micrarchaeia archaeon]